MQSLEVGLLEDGCIQTLEGKFGTIRIDVCRMLGYCTDPEHHQKGIREEAALHA